MEKERKRVNGIAHASESQVVVIKNLFKVLSVVVLVAREGRNDVKAVTDLERVSGVTTPNHSLYTQPYTLFCVLVCKLMYM